MNIIESLTMLELKDYLLQCYNILAKIDNYKNEKIIDATIHRIKRQLERDGIYVREKIKPEFVKIKWIRIYL